MFNSRQEQINWVRTRHLHLVSLFLLKEDGVTQMGTHLKLYFNVIVVACTGVTKPPVNIPAQEKQIVHLAW